MNASGRSAQTSLPLHRARRGRRWPSPILFLAAALVLCLGLLLVRITLPVGPMYWDVVVYLDGGHRVLNGQFPSVDFFAPVGPLAYWLAAGGMALFPDAQPLLLVQWSLLVVAAPAMALVLADADRRSRAVAFALLAPFLVFQLLPMNVEQYSAFPSVDGYGIYNRHVCELLYVLTSALLFARSRRVLLAVIACTMLPLLLLKVTGFLAGGLLCAFALATGRVSVRMATAIAALAAIAMLALQWATGVPVAYVRDIATLVAMNDGSLLPRFLQAASIHFGILCAGTLLFVALLVLSRRDLAAGILALRHRWSFYALGAWLDRPLFWLGVGLFAGLSFETQNTGGQAFIFLWPILLAILLDSNRPKSPATILIFSLVAATAMPPLVNVLHRFARAMVGQIQYAEVPNEHLRALGLSTQRPELFERVRTINAIYAEYPEAYQAMADRNVLPAYSLYADIDFQIGSLMAADEAVGAILDREARMGQRFETIMSLDFANPFPYLLDRQATRLIAIGADPYRAVPTPSEDVLRAVSRTDLVLLPTCPITSANLRLRMFYSSALAGREEFRLSPCWTASVREGLGVSQ